MAHHVQKKAAAKANRYRPKKHRPSDINRKAPTHNVNPLASVEIPQYEVVEKATPTPQAEVSTSA